MEKVTNAHMTLHRYPVHEDKFTNRNHLKNEVDLWLEILAIRNVGQLSEDSAVKLRVRFNVWLIRVSVTVWREREAEGVKLTAWSWGLSPLADQLYKQAWKRRASPGIIHQRPVFLMTAAPVRWTLLNGSLLCNGPFWWVRPLKIPTAALTASCKGQDPICLGSFGK